MSQFVVTTGAYEANEFRFPPRRAVTFIISNQGVYIQYALDIPGVSTAGAVFMPANGDYLPPGIYRYDEVDSNGLPYVGARVKSALASSPAQVSILYG